VRSREIARREVRDSEEGKERKGRRRVAEKKEAKGFPI